MLMGQMLIGWLIRILAVVAVLAGASPATDTGIDLAGVDLGGVFGEASASATELTNDTMEVDLEVEADPEAVVVAHLIEPGGAQDTLPLVARSSGRFGIRTEVRKVDYVVVFEVVGDLPAQSQPLRLTDLGVEPALLGVLPGSQTDLDEPSSTTQLWGWAGLGLAAAALAVLAFWALPDRRAKEAARRQTPDVAGQVDQPGSPAGDENHQPENGPKTVGEEENLDRPD